MRTTGVAPKYQISTALKLFDEDSDKSVRASALIGVFDVLRRAPRELRADILSDPGISLPERITNALADNALRDIIINLTGELAGEPWHPRDGTTAVNKTLNWWQEWKGKTLQENQDRANRPDAGDGK
jgi:hypothetical protein